MTEVGQAVHSFYCRLTTNVACGRICGNPLHSFVRLALVSGFRISIFPKSPIRLVAPQRVCCSYQIPRPMCGGVMGRTTDCMLRIVRADTVVWDARLVGLYKTRCPSPVTLGYICLPSSRPLHPPFYPHENTKYLCHDDVQGRCYSFSCLRRFGQSSGYLRTPFSSGHVFELCPSSKREQHIELIRANFGECSVKYFQVSGRLILWLLTRSKSVLTVVSLSPRQTSLQMPAPWSLSSLARKSQFLHAILITPNQ